MNIIDKFKNKLRCTCNNVVSFEIIDNIECDWGDHIVIQCPSCQELFCIDNQCPAFQDVTKLANINTGLYSNDELETYRSHSHPN
ncbi:MAG: hypothetical protein ACW9W3_04255 [Candidatus Nitrosopumilus sp. bin_68KS]